MVLLIVAAQPLLLWLAAWWVARRTLCGLARGKDSLNQYPFYHRANLVLRSVLLMGFAFAVLGTAWPEWFRLDRVAPGLQVLADLLVLSPFLAGAIALWLGTFAVESALRNTGLGLFRTNAPTGPDPRGPVPVWRLWNYLDFNIRHQFLVVAAPMTLVLFAANLTGGYERQLREWSGWVWTPDVVLAGAAALVFVTSPLLLRRIWRTESMPPGDVRSGLEALCRRIGLSVRDILIWRSDGLMINAAVMGVVSPLRYVLLSDGLLATMSPQQVEAVFGHEAGHVRHRHILHFLMFALVGWIATATVMEAAAQTAVWAEADPSLWVPLVQAIGVTGTLLFWGIGFGWLSRRFERQADAFAARCAAPALGECGMPCSVHLDANTSREADGRVCASGAALFASALDQVALLNAIPRNEPSWRHSSIASRVRFLMSLAEDPAKAVRFERLIRRVKAGMLAAALIGLAAWAGYWLAGAGPAIVQVQAGLR